MKKSVLMAFLMVSWLGWQSAGASVVNYTDFSNAALNNSFTLHGSAQGVLTGDGNVIRLSKESPDGSTYRQTGQAFLKEKVKVAAGFSTYFQFRITGRDGVSDDDGGEEGRGADGIVFAVHNDESPYGDEGYGIGYEGIGNSIGVEFDTWKNHFAHESSNHVGIDFNGNVTHGPSQTQHVDTRFDNGEIWHSWIDYDGLTLEIRAASGENAERPGDAILSHTFSIKDHIGADADRAWVGFTSGTWNAWGNHDIVSWEFREAYNPIHGPSPVPLPTSIFLLGIGLAGMAGFSRRRA